MHEIKAIIRPERLQDVIHALREIPDLPGVTVSVVQGYGRRRSSEDGRDAEFGETEMAKLETVVPPELLARVIEKIQGVAHTGGAGDGKIFIVEVQQAIKIRSQERGTQAL